MIVNRKLGREIFHGGREEAAIWDSGRARNGHGCRESAMLVLCKLFGGAIFRRKIFGLNESP
jgi:hypothetical protein